MAISAEQWEAVNKELDFLYGQVKFVFEGRTLCLRWVCVSKSPPRYMLSVYIDGKIIIGQGFEEIGGKANEAFDPFVKIVWRTRSRTISLFKKSRTQAGTKKYLAALNRLKKRYPDKVMVWYDPCFPSATSLVRQYKKLEGLELVEVLYG